MSTGIEKELSSPYSRISLENKPTSVLEIQKLFGGENPLRGACCISSHAGNTLSLVYSYMHGETADDNSLQYTHY